jgi:dTDP-4-dehydrorhamnose reductase
MKVAVTGGSGLLGSNLALELSDGGHEVTALYRQNPIRANQWENSQWEKSSGMAARKSAGACCSEACDLTDGAGVARLLARVKPALIVHCAAETNLEWCENHPRDSMRINGEVPGLVASIARSIGAGLVYISTDAVFDGAAGGYRETDAVSPVNEYARGKAAGEAAVIREMPEALIVRVNIYGWNMRPKNSLAEWALELLRKGQCVPGFHDVTFSPVLVNDLAGWILELIEAGFAGTYHLASCDHSSKHDFLCELAAVFDLESSLVRKSSMEDSLLIAPRPRNTWLRTDKIAAALGRSMPSIRNGLERFRALSESGFASRLKSAAV